MKSRRTILIEPTMDRPMVRIVFLSAGNPFAFIETGEQMRIGQIVDNWMFYAKMPEDYHGFTLKERGKA